MPIADFPGERNWGYDGVNLFAPARAYGGPEGFKKLVNAAHKEGLAVVLDVVYNHLGPDGNYLRDFSAHYFTSEKKTPWGDALDFSNRQVREFFISNALYWAHEYHVDGLRLDATHAILDDNERHILEEIPARVRETPAHRPQLRDLRGGRAQPGVAASGRPEKEARGSTRFGQTISTTRYARPWPGITKAIMPITQARPRI